MVTQLKNLLVATILLFSNLAFCQNLDSLGLNDNPELNSYESTFLNEKLEKQRQRAEFNFTEKQIGFALGHGPRHYGIRTKSEYFEEAKEYHSNNSQIVDILVVLTEQEKDESGGFDAIIVSWSKFGVNDKARTELINNLKSGT
ncbi:hypothetical protein [Reichenbachiella sp.]|uniref:hypothetical protein n=1 Tax=Reichenbachiella sp. TaxID=2184521 RepID=UPI003B5B2263